MKKLVTLIILLNISFYSSSSFALIIDCELHGAGTVGFAISANDDTLVMRNACFSKFKNSAPSISAAHKASHGIDPIEPQDINPTLPECYSGHKKDFGIAGGL